MPSDPSATPPGVPEVNFGNPRLGDETLRIQYVPDARAEIDALHRMLATLREHLVTLQAERENVSSQLWDTMNTCAGWEQRAIRAERILAALRAPSKEVWGAALEAYNNAPFATHTPRLIRALLAAVAAAEQEVGRE